MAASKPKRRWYQFSLRTLLVFVLLCAILCSWFGVKVQQAARQREAVAALRKDGGGVLYGYEIDNDYRRRPKAQPPAPNWLLNLLGVDFFEDVIVMDCGTEVDDHVTVHLKELTSLIGLSLHSTQITDAGLEHLKGLTNLEKLWLDGTQITDVGLEHLKGLTNLEYLSLGGTQITGEGLGHLKRLTSLRYLGLMDTQVTGVGVEQLQEALPNCFIDY